jgi:circadian clock protein KaiC
MHELLSYLGQMGTLTLLVLAQHGLVGPVQGPIDLSYLSDAVLLLRYFEFEGEVRRALSVVKKRSGHHEHAIREFRLSGTGIAVGPPLKGFSGVSRGHADLRGTGSAVLDDDGGT